MVYKVVIVTPEVHPEHRLSFYSFFKHMEFLSNDAKGYIVTINAAFQQFQPSTVLARWYCPAPCRSVGTCDQSWPTTSYLLIHQSALSMVMPSALVLA